MKSSIIFSGALTVALVSASPYYTTRAEVGDWIVGGPDDLRGPCPMMNTLANHGFNPRDGRNLTRDNVVSGLTNGLNFNSTVANIMWEQAIFINPEPNATIFTLDQLNVHGVLEHDGSLSRNDAYFGNNHVFNQSVFDTTAPYWTSEIMDANQLANGKVARQLASKAFNPDYSFSSTVEAFSLGELAAPILIFGDIDAGTVRRDLVVSFFENEKLPTDLGWTKQVNAISLDQVTATSKRIADAAVLITGSNTTETAAHKVKRVGHFGVVV